MNETKFNKILNNIKKNISKNLQKIVFSEGTDERILTAVNKLTAEKLCHCILVGDPTKISAKLKTLHLQLDDSFYEIIDSCSYANNKVLVEHALKARQGKNTIEQISRWVEQPNYFATMLVATGFADGALGGATYSTANTVRPALQIVKSKAKIVSSYLVMVRGDEIYLFADCAINDKLDGEKLALIATQTALNAKKWQIDPHVALLSFSTHGSAKGESATNAQTAVEILSNNQVDFKFDGDIQFDAAINKIVAKVKCKHASTVAGCANCFIFPNLDAGNIGYKIAQRLGNFQAIGPIIQGLNAPINDLSRGCSAEDVYLMAIITANQV